MIDINEKFIQIRGKIATDKKHALGDDIAVMVTVTSVEQKDNDDGTVDLIYKAKLWTEAREAVV